MTSKSKIAGCMMVLGTLAAVPRIASAQQYVLDPSMENEYYPLCSNSATPNQLAANLYSTIWGGTGDSRFLSDNTTCSVAQFPTGMAPYYEHRSIVLHTGGPYNASAELGGTGLNLLGENFYSVCIAASPYPVNGTAVVSNSFKVFVRSSAELCRDKEVLSRTITSNTYGWNEYSESFEIDEDDAGCRYNRIYVVMTPDIPANGGDYHGQMLFDKLQVNAVASLKKEDRICEKAPKMNMDRSVSGNSRAAFGAGAAAELALVPNPASSQVTVTLPGGGEGVLTITDVQGRVVLTQAVTGLQTSVDLTALPAGLYIVRVKTEAGTMQSKLVKQ